MNYYLGAPRRNHQRSSGHREDHPARFIDPELTVEHLEEVWRRQRGRCALTGIPLKLRYSGHKIDHTELASLDCIIPELGYVYGNVQFVSARMNHAKHSANNSVALGFVRKVRLYGGEQDRLSLMRLMETSGSYTVIVQKGNCERL